MVSAVALFAMALRLVVAFLFVPTTVISGVPAEAGYEVVLCTEHGPMQIAINENDGQSSHDDQHKPRICPFCYAGAGIPFALAAELPPPPPSVGFAPREPRTVAVFPRHPRIYAPTARGPPQQIA
ncbi:exported protein of unknown function [Candidatus Filomicrobium marinum]|uniref:DUF2946 domain-containing protein n=1 Tax=Candidatus Filomicrobium marinum TaxID=1608628 RepID=A0A0D6JCW7_9HYPH|nr:DUF2946 family protein [Candidatus Filomicrobium marinum]CFX12686.1 exported protein of unknown function [Candidatus Filomicrobium marinum]CPR17481.1 exported protein of unknown function [Candidatus Filomicrobium marinum]